MVGSAGVTAVNLSFTAPGTSVELRLYSLNEYTLIDDIRLHWDRIVVHTICDNSRDYRYGFNGQEKDNDVSRLGNSNTAEFWQYDTRLGRRWNTDPILFTDMSPYAAFLNSPIQLDDVGGDCPFCPLLGREAIKQTASYIARTFFFAAATSAVLDVTVQTVYYGDLKKALKNTDVWDAAIDGGLAVMTGGASTFKTLFSKGTKFSTYTKMGVVTFELMAATTDLTYDAGWKSVIGEGDHNKEVFDVLSSIVIHLGAEYTSDQILTMFQKWSKTDMAPENFAPKTNDEKDLARRINAFVTSEAFKKTTETGMTYMEKFIIQVLEADIKYTLNVDTLDIRKNFTIEGDETNQDNLIPPIINH